MGRAALRHSPPLDFPNTAEHSVDSSLLCEAYSQHARVAYCVHDLSPSLILQHPGYEDLKLPEYIYMFFTAFGIIMLKNYSVYVQELDRLHGFKMQTLKKDLDIFIHFIFSIYILFPRLIIIEFLFLFIAPGRIN